MSPGELDVRIIATLQDLDRRTRDFLLDVDGGARLADVLRRMGADSAGAATGEAAVRIDGRAVDPGRPVRDVGLRHAAVIAVAGDPAPAPAPATGLVDVGIAGGPGSGRVVRLGPGRHVLGGVGTPGAVLPGLPDSALVLEVDIRMRVRVRAPGAVARATLAGRPIAEDFLEWPADSVILVGDRLLQYRPASRPEAVLAPSEDGSVWNFHRPPRVRFTEPATTFTIPAPPSAPPRNSWPWVAALLPVVGAVVTALVFASPTFLLLAALSPVVAFANAFVSRRQGRRSHADHVAEHAATVDGIESDIQSRRAVERQRLQEAAPSAADLWPVATGPAASLWARRVTDDDHLLLRVGTADLPSAVVVEDMREPLEHRRRLPATLPDVPATISLTVSGIIGVAGSDASARSVGRWMVAQLAVLQSPRDLQLYVLTSGEREREWGWTARLPHAVPALGQDARALVGNDAETIARRVAELAQLVSARRAQLEGSHGAVMRFGPEIVVVWDGARRLRTYPGVTGILRDGPRVGVYSVCLEEDEQSLPEECTAVVTIAPDGAAGIRSASLPTVRRVRLDLVDDAWLEGVSRALAPLRDPGDDDAALPAEARLTEVMALEPVGAAGIARGWSAGARTTRAALGVSLEGAFSIDLAKDGPHGLVAGTTGSGKSELLQTIVASLAVANRPDAMNFVLIDYKGGAAFKDAVRLPHTVGMVTDLDAHLVERALTSLGAELTRREHLLAGVGAKDIDDYIADATDQPRPPLPRLLIVIDEFASMARELPDFVKGLVNIAQRGRSLGIHLILATQRPSGVVSAEIRANTNLRICLRVTDAADSSDVIDAADAARIPAALPGRAYVRLGHSSLIPFQSARVGGRSLGSVAATPEAPVVVELAWQTAGYPLPAPRAATAEGETTDLSRLVIAAREAADQLQLPAPHSPWLPPLPASVLVTDLASPATAAGRSEAAALPAAPWALLDVPGQQAQVPVEIDFAEFGHLFLAGAARSGRSQALRTIAGSIAARISPADVHLFGIDMGNGALMPLSRLPHTGAVAQRSERDRITRLLDRLQAELTRRQELLGRQGVADIGEQRAQAEAADRLPHLVLLLDRWESFTSTFADVDGGVLVETILGFLREGASAGLHLILAGDRSLLSGRISVLTEEKWMLRLADRGDYGLGGIPTRAVPDTIPDGRAIRAGSGLEAQIGLLAPDVSAAAQAAALAEIGASARARNGDIPPAVRPLRIDLLPSSLTWEEAQSYMPTTSRGSMWSMVGVGGDDLSAVGPDLAASPTFLVAGPPRSGRTNVLAVMSRSLLASGSDLVLLCPRRSALTALLADAPGVRRVFDHVDVTEPELSGALAPGERPVVLVIDDGEHVRDMPAKDFLRSWIRDASGGDRGLILGGSASEVGGGFSGWQVDVRNNQRGALLSPRTTLEGDLVGVRVPRSHTTSPITPGRALVHLGTGSLQVVQVPQLVD